MLANVNPLSLLLKERLPAIDVGVMSHGFAEHGRDYILILENSFGPSPGNYRLTFTHVVQLTYDTAVGDKTWQESWTDDFIDYKRWLSAGEPDGYVFGNNWSMAYPGFGALEDDAAAASWSERLGRNMYAAAVETDRFKIGLIFHDALLEQVNDEASTVSQVIIPLPPRP
jgi:hypothetical protein